MFALLIAFLAPMLHAVSNILDARVSNFMFKSNSSTIFYLGITNLFVLPFLVLLGGMDILYVPITMWPILFVVALFEILYQIPYFKSLKRVDTSIVGALFSLGKILLPVFAFVIVGEKLCFWQYIGFFVIIISTLFLNLKKGVCFQINFAFYLMLMASLMITLNTIFSKKALLEMNWMSFSFYYIILSDVFLFLALIHPKFLKNIKKDFKVFKKNFPLLMLMEIVDRAAVLTGIFALSLLPVMVRAGISSTTPIFVLLYSVILYKIFGSRFKENLGRGEVVKKLLCFLFIIIGVVLTVIE
ncbi:MAG: EamA family transporter [Alphaproteobacteria bacterium]|nr:EamA family transporter [Alphaproteobacteria bacterium]